MRSVVICEYVRSPFTLAYKGALAKIRPDELLGQIIKTLVMRSGIDPTKIEDLIVGCAFPEGEQGLNIARIAVFLAELPKEIAGVTMNRFCGSSMQAIHTAVGAIACGAGEAFICAGVESMSRIPMTGFNPMPHPELFERNPDVYEAMGITAENLARHYHIARKEQESFALLSHQKAADAKEKGYFDQEIVPIKMAEKSIDEDGCIRGDTSLDALAQLNPVFEKKGTVTAGTSSPLTDGAAAVLICSEEFADDCGLAKLARIKSMAVSGCAPGMMGIGPVAATKKVLTRAGLSLNKVEVIELNEAFSVQALACMQELGLNPDYINYDGGALALGHPLGATGARIVGKAAQILAREGKNYALATQCIGGGQGIATLLEAI